MSSAFAVLIIMPLAFGIGFATQRGNVCSVLAARQIAETGKATRLVAFLTSSLWALVVVVPLGWLTAGAIGLSPTYEDLGLAVSGGALYGLGTFINGACGFGTAARVVSGKLSFLAAFPGMALGAGLAVRTGLPALRLVGASSPLREPSLAGLAVLLAATGLVVLTVISIVRSHRRAGLGLGQVLRAARWRTAFAMMILGVLGGLLFATGEPWSYPTLLQQVGGLAFRQKANFAITTLVGPLALLLGAITGAMLGGRFALQAVSSLHVVRSLFGGSIMGFAAMLVPGGNDVLLLRALPSLALHGVFAYLAMLGVQIILAVSVKRWKDRKVQWGEVTMRRIAALTGIGTALD